MLKDYDFETEKMSLVDKLTQRRESNKTQLKLLRPQKSLMSPSYNFYKPSTNPNNFRAGSKKTESKVKPRPNKNKNNSDAKTFAKTGNGVTSAHNSKPSRDMTMNSIKNIVLGETSNKGIENAYEISQLQSEQISAFADIESNKLKKQVPKRGTSVFSIHAGTHPDNSYTNGIKGLPKKLELDMMSPNNLKRKRKEMTPNKARDFRNKKHLEVNIFRKQM